MKPWVGRDTVDTSHRQHRHGRRAATLFAVYGIAVLVAGAGYEIYASVHYSRWRAHFDNYGWMGKMTVPSSNPVLRWEYRPYGAYHGEMGDIVVPRYGFRDEDFPIPSKPAGTVRVAFIGDSVTLGMLNRPEDTFVKRFEAAANVSCGGGAIQALNFGVDGYDAIQVRELLGTRVFPFQPDCIVYMMCLNDFDFQWSAGDKQRYFKRPKSFLLEALESLYIRWFQHNLTQYTFQKHHRTVFRSVLEMDDLARSHHATFIVAVIPAFYPGSFRDYPLRRIHADIDRGLSHDGVPHLDLLDAFVEGGSNGEDVAFDLWHPNPQGNSVIARSLMLALCERLRIPEAGRD